MDLTLNIIPTPLPDIFESAHERLIQTNRTRRELPPLPRQSKITVIRMPYNRSQYRFQTSRNAKTEACCRKRTSESPAKPSPKQPAEAPASIVKPVKMSAARKQFPASQRPSPLPSASHSHPPLSKIPMPYNIPVPTCIMLTKPKRRCTPFLLTQPYLHAQCNPVPSISRGFTEPHNAPSIQSCQNER